MTSSLHICDLMYFSFEDLRKVISQCNDDDLFLASIVLPNEVLFKCQLFFGEHLKERRLKGLSERGPVPLEEVRAAEERILSIMTSIKKPGELLNLEENAKIYVKILSREKDAWRGVNALEFDKGIYLIRDYPHNLPELYEEWEFPMTSIVKVRPFIKDNKTLLVAVELFKL